ncbi:MAG: hypothetical protein HGA45_11970 [Chloroflexales bacterium]|nr:hypothetical protein [Chloroflexales bacterium]
MRSKHGLIVGAVVVGLVLVVALRDFLAQLAVLLVALALSALPSLLALGVIGALSYIAYRYVTTHKGSVVPAALGGQTAAPHGSRELTDGLAVAFRRNNTRQLQLTLAKLPPWPISQHIQHTAQELTDLKRSIYRAQAEGVPAPMVERYLQNMGQAAESVWQLASKVDAVALQQVPYALVAPRLQQEEQQLQQLQQALKDSREGIALLILSGTRSEVLGEVEDDLRALTQAIKGLELAQTLQRVS